VMIDCLMLLFPMAIKRVKFFCFINQSIPPCIGIPLITSAGAKLSSIKPRRVNFSLSLVCVSAAEISRPRPPAPMMWMGSMVVGLWMMVFG